MDPVLSFVSTASMVSHLIFAAYLTNPATQLTESWLNSSIFNRIHYLIPTDTLCIRITFCLSGIEFCYSPFNPLKSFCDQHIWKFTHLHYIYLSFCLPVIYHLSLYLSFIYHLSNLSFLHYMMRELILIVKTETKGSMFASADFQENQDHLGKHFQQYHFTLWLCCHSAILTLERHKHVCLCFSYITHMIMAISTS